jgi:hypothetical protein
VHVRDLHASDHTERGARRESGSRVVGVHVDLERRGIADDEERVSELLEAPLDRRGVEVRTLDDEHRAVAVARELLVNRLEAEPLAIDRRIGERLPRNCESDAAHDLDETRAARVHDSGRRQDLEVLRCAGERRLASRQHCLKEGVRRLGVLCRPFRLLRHLPEHRQHRPFNRLPHRSVGGVARRPEGASEKGQSRVVVLGHDLCEAADDLREDYPGVSPRGEERRARDLLGQKRSLLGPRSLDRLHDAS